MSTTTDSPRRIAALLGAWLMPAFVGCAMVPGETRVPEHRQVASRHHYYHAPKTPEMDNSCVLGIPKLNPKWWAANSDDPLPWWWKPDAPLGERQRTWFLRNPFHNFTHYVLGVTDRHGHRVGLNAHSIWNDTGSFNASYTQVGPFLYLPMISNRGRLVEWYVGWRESGNFGAALRLAQHDSDGTGPRGRSPLAKATAARERAAQEEAAQDNPLPLPPSE